MQISDLVNQYTSMSGRKEPMTGTKGVQKLVSTVRDMSSGNVFEGTVNSVKGGKVVLALPNGQKITARMDGKVPLSEGQSMFFQVKSNDGTTLAIRPFTVGGNSVNLTLMNALNAAGLPVEGRNLTMVNSMMQQQMPIDAGSLSQMARIVSANENINVQTIVNMHKLGIPITEEFASQFENYMDDKQAISKAMEGFMEELPEAMASEDIPEENLKEINVRLLDILTEGLESGKGMTVLAAGEDFMPYDTEYMEPLTGEGDAAAQAAGETAPGAQETGQAAAQAGEIMPETADAAVSAEGAVMQGENAQTVDMAAEGETAAKPVYVNEHSLLALLDDAQSENTEAVLRELPGMEEHPSLFAGGRLNLGSDSVEVLHAIRQALSGEEEIPRETMTKLFSDEGIRNLMKDALSQQWTIKPQELGKGDKINSLYEKLENQIDRMEQAVKATGMENTNLSQAAADVRNNIDFMNQINQTYTYAQIPLAMNGQNASGELFVYTNKKHLAQEGEKDLTAFLHLDLDHLGSTDVSVRLKGTDVDTSFFFDNDESFRLVEQNLPKLEARLKAKGYNCRLSVKNENKHVNFVEDFLMKDQPTAGQLHRYSFDMRA